jgi:steroid 5-alpha reductase family enzyme
VVHLGTSWIGPAGIAWALLAVIWLILSWREPRGRAWHQVLAVAPLAAFATALWGPAGVAEPVALWLLIGGGVLAALVLAWAWGVAARNHGVMDVIYPLTVLAGALVAAWCVGFEQWIMFALAPIAIWSIRLAVQTYGHNMGSEREPYASWRKRFGAKWLWWSAFQIHLLQGVTVWIWCAPIAFAFAAPEPRPLWPLVLGGAIWPAGFALQMTADQQLAAFKRDPNNRGKLLDTGVWSLVRHPNYLGEAVMWWGYFAFALAHPFGWLTIFAPLYAGWFMGYASAAPYKERHMAKTRPETWAEYCRRTPRFLPWPRSRQGT